MAITVSKEFKAAFKKCMEHWQVTGEELEYEKDRCRANYEQAAQCYLAMAEKIGKLV